MKLGKTLPMKRKRGLGPTQSRVLAALLAVPKEGIISRMGLQEQTGLTLPQVRSALRGLERRGLAEYQLDENHVTAPRWWSAVRWLR